MNLQHFWTFLWLHWRLRLNQIKRGGVANAVILGILLVGGVLLGALMFFAMLLIGIFALADVGAPVLMYVWDGLVVAFLFSWMIGLLAELQRAEALSLQKFLHLPVPLGGVFLLNYLSSLVSFTLVLIGPAMAGLILGLAISRGPAMLWLVPLAAAFLLLVTAVSYQFQGWLASLMVNKRRRRTIIVVVTSAFVLLAQLPNLINFYQPWSGRHDEVHKRFEEEQKELQRAFNAREINAEELQRRQKESIEKLHEQSQRTLQTIEKTARILNVVLPPGWLAWAAMALAEGDYPVVFLCLFGMTLLGSASLWRAYRTTLLLYTGQFTARMTATKVSAPAPSTPAPPKSPAPPASFLERELPGLSPQASAITFAMFRSLVRAPEAKMLLLTPVLMVVVFGAMFLRSETHPPEPVRPLFPVAAMTMILFTLTQLLGNQFGFDRSGFRVFVLCPARRGDILLGKNLAVAPLAGTLGLIGLGVLQIVYPMRVDHLLATLPAFVSMYLIFCLLANCLAILAPMPIASGTMRPTSARGLPLLLNFALTLVLPVALAPVLLPLGVEVLAEEFGSVPGVPICLLLSLLECVGVVFLYRWIIGWQGVWLHAREQRILEIVAAKAE